MSLNLNSEDLQCPLGRKCRINKYQVKEETEVNIHITTLSLRGDTFCVYVYSVYGICVPVHGVLEQAQRPGEVSFSIILHLTSWRHAQPLNKTLSAFQMDRLVSKPQ